MLHADSPLPTTCERGGGADAIDASFDAPVASADGADGSVKIEQDARMYATILERGESVSHGIAAGRKGWLHVARGSAMVNGTALQAGDGLAIEGAETLSISSPERGEVLLFDLTS